jgi:hypothetical protein
MAKNKNETKKDVKPSGKVKITKPNGSIIYRDKYEGLAKQYEAKGCTVEEV